jgi:hypothetical protein
MTAAPPDIRPVIQFKEAGRTQDKNAQAGLFIKKTRGFPRTPQVRLFNISHWLEDHQSKNARSAEALLRS